ncbi:hypothetical protein [Rhodobacter sp. SY28-1]|uniref:hypothetical protein n=1 Tax=Rhodobacter sp. SY28-1 TaxID=2562317 RepID=UPI0010C0F901|nr:hypothetical protein [Rhodobacter sp. SY28-1]
MTVCVAVKVHDCIVFAADSATSLSAVDGAGNQVIINIYENANKVFNLHKGLPICAMTAGIGNFGPSSISTMSKDLRRLFASDDPEWKLEPENYTIEEVAQKARRFFFERRFAATDPAPQGTFDYWIGGYSADAELGEIWRIQIQNGNCGAPVCVATQDQTTIEWGGQPEAINRLLLGYGQALPQALLDAGLEPDKLDGLLRHIVQRSQANVLSDAMPVIDAIKLAEFLVDTTKKFVQFLPGGNTVGGAVDISAVTKHEGFKWISRKHFYDQRFNPLETDHAK